MVFVFGSVYVVNYVYRLAYVEPGLHSRDDSYLIMMDKFFLMCCCNQFASILLKIFASIFIMDIGLKFSFLVGSLPGFGIRMMFRKMIWEGFPLFGLFEIVLEGMVPAPPCVSGRIRL